MPLKPFYKEGWFAVVCAITTACALTSYWYFDSYPELVQNSGRSSPVSEVAIGTLGFLFFSIPFVLGTALIRPRAHTILFAHIHAGAYP